MEKEQLIQTLKIAYLHLIHFDTIPPDTRARFVETLRDVLAIEGNLPEEEII